MFRSILVFGLIAGVVAGLPMSVMVLAMSGQTMMDHGMVLGYLTMLVALSAVFVAIKRRRDGELGGVIRFWPAFAMGVGISFVAGVIYVAAWELAQAVTHMDFASDYARAMLAQQRAKGASAEALARLSAEMEAFKLQYANPLYRLPMTFAEIFPVGLLVSLVSAGLLRNPRFLPAR